MIVVGSLLFVVVFCCVLCVVCCLLVDVCCVLALFFCLPLWCVLFVVC